MSIKKALEVNELQKYIILLAHANDEPINGRIKLQSVMFLLSDIIDKVKEQGRYGAYKRGPYSEEVDKAFRYLEEIGTLSNSDDKLAVTEEGRDVAKEIMKSEDKDTLRMLEDYKKFLHDLTDEEVLTYIYSAYPATSKESAEYEKLKPHMEDRIFSLLEKEKISSQRAAELLHKTQTHVIKKMNKMGMAVLSGP